MNDLYWFERLLGVSLRGESRHGAPVTRPYLSPPKHTPHFLDRKGEHVIGVVHVDYDTGDVLFRRV